ncbi:hypothetical protein ACFLXB_08120 [Chloroflexota bacterium]
MTSYLEKKVEFNLGKIPNPLKLIPALMRPDQPFVMINLITFNETASGKFDHLSGREAYQLYAQSVQKAQAPLGSRLLWSGDNLQKMSEGIAPSFHSIGLLEYASPKAFLQFLTKGGSNTKARAAGLQGQWLIASTTLEENKITVADDEGIVLIELCGDLDHQKGDKKFWQEKRKSYYQTVGGKTVWHGHCDHHIIGTLAPGIEDVLVTWFPDTSIFEQEINDLKRKGFLLGCHPYIAYRANSLSDLLPELC